MSQQTNMKKTIWHSTKQTVSTNETTLRTKSKQSCLVHIQGQEPKDVSSEVPGKHDQRKLHVIEFTSDHHACFSMKLPSPSK